MQRNLWLVLFIALVSCNNGPDVTVCLIDAQHNTLECSDSDGHKKTLRFEDAENYVCFSPRDTERMIKAYENHNAGCLP
jgi:hypothetical protein